MGGGERPAVGMQKNKLWKPEYVVLSLVFFTGFSQGIPDIKLKICCDTESVFAYAQVKNPACAPIWSLNICLYRALWSTYFSADLKVWNQAELHPCQETNIEGDI